MFTRKGLCGKINYMLNLKKERNEYNVRTLQVGKYKEKKGKK